MDKLQWFKFTPSDWMMGKIQKCPPDTRGMFMNLCCLYWNKECELSFEDAEIEVDEHIEVLIKKKIVRLDGENIRISFLDEQMEEILETSEKRREAANKRWKKKNANDMQVYASALQNDADKIKSKSKSKSEKREEVEGEKKKKETKFLCSIININELDNNIDKITFSFWQLFKSNLQEAGVTKTTTLDKATLEKWRTPVRLAMDQDGRTRDEFEEIWKFLKKNEFWKKNIQSTSKLREQFERLLVESRTAPTKKNNQPQLSEDYKQRLAKKLRS